MRRLLVPLLAIATAVAACASDDGGGDTSARPTPTPTSGADTTEPAPEPLDASVAGPYGVGRQTVTVTDPDRPDRTLAVDVWYPTDATSGDPSTYSFAPGIEYDSAVALDAPPVAEGPFPLVVYSHGSGGLRYIASYLTERLASHGVVVAAPDHAGNTTVDDFLGTSDPSEVVARNRPLDVSAVLDAVLAGSIVSEVAAQVDADRVGVIGHSLGAQTALAVAGGSDGIPADPRVSAVVAMAPAARGLTDEDLAAVDVPTMVLSGTLDEVTAIEPNTERTVAQVSGRPLVRVDLVGGTHQSFSDVCLYLEIMPNLPAVTPEILAVVEDQAGRTCDPDVLDVDRAQQLVNRYAVAFLLDHLADDDRAAAAIDPDSAPEEVELSVVG